MDSYLVWTDYEGHIRIVLEQHQVKIAETDVPDRVRQFVQVRVLSEIVRPELFAELRTYIKEFANDRWPMQISYFPSEMDGQTKSSSFM